MQRHKLMENFSHLLFDIPILMGFNTLVANTWVLFVNFNLAKNGCKAVIMFLWHYTKKKQC